MNLGIKSKSFAASENQEWLASRHGTQEADSITLDAAACVALFATGFVPSGIPLGLVTATGLYAPAVTGAADGSAVVVGHLLTSIDLTSGGDVAAASAANSPAALLWHGEIVTSKIPAYTGAVPMATAGNQPKLIRYV